MSLAHQGVLFLDEAPEFSSRVLQSLREPLEQGMLTVARAGRSAWFPSRFQLVLTANACPCGQTGRENGVCFCSGQEVRRYWDRIGTPLLDRIDLRVFVTPESPQTVLSRPTTDPRDLVRRIDRARRRQRQRGQPSNLANAALPPRDLERACQLTPAGRQLLAEAGLLYDWSSRALHALMRVGRTVADLNDSETVSEDHLTTALTLRKPRGEEYWER